MKKYLSALAALALLFACTPEGATVVELTGIALSEHDITFEVGDNKVLVVTFTPENATNKDVTWESSNPSIATVTDGIVVALAPGTTEVVAKSGNLTDKCTVTVKKPVPDGAVDLGLSVYWATCNIGANAPHKYGDFYAWGETETKKDYYWKSYIWCKGDYKTLTKYNYSSSYGTVDDKTVLDADDDVAHVKLGGNWRMPTDDEWTELRENCTWTFTAQNGNYGILLTSNKNGNSIFLPAGDKWGDGMNVDTFGYYWSSSLSTEYPYRAPNMLITPDGVTRQDRGRQEGFSVRPVSE